MAFERVWLGCGLNAALAGLQVVFSCAVADMDVLSRVMYLKDGKAAWPKGAKALCHARGICTSPSFL